MINNDIWSEKYRPKKLDDIIGQDDIIKKLKVYVIEKRMQHLLFSGSPGCGKTTTSLCLAREMFGENWYSNFKELNSSDARGIDVVRGEIKEFASTKSLGNFPFKIILLDECDSLTIDAQNALRRTMEKHSSDCKFILSCNYSGKIIEPIQSRTFIFRFKPIKSDVMKNHLKLISVKENKKITDDALEAITYISEGDLRKALGCLETSGLGVTDITIDNVYKSSGLAHPKYIRDLIESALKQNFFTAINLLDILLIEEGINSLDIIKQMFKEVMVMNMTDKMKIKIIDSIGECDFRISDGADERIQMHGLLASLMSIGY